MTIRPLRAPALAAALQASACASLPPEAMRLSDPMLPRTPERESHDWTVLVYWRTLVLECPLPDNDSFNVDIMAGTVNEMAPPRTYDKHRFEGSIAIGQARAREAMAKARKATCDSVRPETDADIETWGKALKATQEARDRAWDAARPRPGPADVSLAASRPPASP
jgi:hypothetical protein